LQPELACWNLNRFFVLAVVAEPRGLANAGTPPYAPNLLNA
jgi:hypothetical protein